MQSERYLIKSGLLMSLALMLMPDNILADAACIPEDVLPENMFPSVRVETTKGDFVIELNRLRAPVTPIIFCATSSTATITEPFFTA